MTPDPRPWLRCRCVSPPAGVRTDPFLHRCPERPDQEDGLCAHCRQTPPCTDPLCTIPGNCCVIDPARILIDLNTPCAVTPTGVPF